MNQFIKQCKGTDSDTVHNLATYWHKGCAWYLSIKYDGQYAQIHITKDRVIFYTSSGKPYINELLADELQKCIPDDMKPIVLEAEYLGNGDGKLGGRADAAVVTTARTAFAKGISYSAKHQLRIFDIIEDESFAIRMKDLDKLRNKFVDSTMVLVVNYKLCTSIENARIACARYVENGWEGIYCKSVLHTHEAGKRVKTAFKFKLKNTTTVKIVGIDEGTGKYAGLIGAFICEDENGMRVNVGSGLTDSIRQLSPAALIGLKIRINYERIDQTYIFPIFIDFLQDEDD